MASSKPGLAVLELGNATGEAASTVLSSLPQHLNGVDQAVDYTFSCSNEASLRKIERGTLQTFRDSVKFRVLDIEQELAEQGIDNETYDLVIISDTSSAVEGVERNLSNVQKLLKPGGKLCDLKITGPGLRFTTILGYVLHGRR